MNEERPERRQTDTWRNDIRGAVDENTRITKAVSDKLDKHIARTAPVNDAWESIEPGIRVLAAIGKAGEWLLDKWKPILIIGVAVKVLMSGGSFSQAWAMLAKIFKPDI